MGRMQAVVADALRGPENHVPLIVEQAKAALGTVYGWLDKELAGGGWATPYGFSLADCAAAPSLFYADWVHPIPEKYEKMRAYRARLLTHPSISRCVEEARPYRAYFRSEEHTSELQSLMRISYADFCVKKKKKTR